LIRQNSIQYFDHFLSLVDSNTVAAYVVGLIVSGGRGATSTIRRRLFWWGCLAECDRSLKHHSEQDRVCGFHWVTLSNFGQYPLDTRALASFFPSRRNCLPLQSSCKVATEKAMLDIYPSRV
jgi:hypothetical protein